jgi:hypothetical protein
VKNGNLLTVARWWEGKESRSGDATNRGVMGKYIRHDRERALRLLELWEADPTWPDRLLAKNRGYPFVRDLREFLRAQNMLPARPPGWTDPLGEEQYGVAKLINLEKHNAIVLKQQMDAINRRMEKLEGRKRASWTLSEPGGLRDHANHPLVRSTGPRDHITTPGGQQTGRSRKSKRSVQNRYEALVKAGLLHLKSEDLQERSIKEIVSDRLASGHKLTTVQGVATRNASPQPGPSHGQDGIGTINRRVRELSPKQEESPPDQLDGAQSNNSTARSTQTRDYAGGSFHRDTGPLTRVKPYRHVSARQTCDPPG